MFTGKSLIKMSDYYFLMSEEDKKCYEVVSKKTLHRWQIVECGRKFRLYHRNESGNAYNFIGVYESILDCVSEVTDRDKRKIKGLRRILREKITGNSRSELGTCSTAF
jgi:hypothetical protein